jgi:hypothetical protein
LTLGALCLLVAELWAAPGRGDSPKGEGEQRYPYDPVCAWGRLADGRGMLVRCLEEGDAVRLATPAKAEVKAEEATPTEKPKVEEPAKPETPPEPAAKPITVEKVGPIEVDTGELPLAVKKLSEPKDRYLECVRNNGGLQSSPAEVHVRFLVRERGRAEGVSVAKSKGMSKEAARCIADVVDRRYVGYPAAPIVGATLPIVISHQGQ